MCSFLSADFVLWLSTLSRGRCRKLFQHLINLERRLTHPSIVRKCTAYEEKLLVVRLPSCVPHLTNNFVKLTITRPFARPFVSSGKISFGGTKLARYARKRNKNGVFKKTPPPPPRASISFS